MRGRRERIVAAKAAMVLLGLGRLFALDAVVAQPMAAAPASIVSSPPAEDYADWRVGVRSDFIAANTVNTGRLLFGVICGSTCVAYAAAPKGCVEGEITPIIANLSTGSFSFVARCWHVENDAILFAEYSQPLEKAINGGEKIGLLFPEKDGRFTATQFSLKGAATAVDRLMTLVEERRKRGDPLRRFVP